MRCEDETFTWRTASRQMIASFFTRITEGTTFSTTRLLLAMVSLLSYETPITAAPPKAIRRTGLSCDTDWKYASSFNRD